VKYYECPTCKTENEEYVKYCKKCGAWLLSDTFPAKLVSRKKKSSTLKIVLWSVGGSILGVISLFIILIIVFASLDTDKMPSENTSVTAGTVKELSKEEFEQMFTEPKKYIGDRVDYYAKVFKVERNSDGTYIQAFANPKESTMNTAIVVKDPYLEVKSDEIIHVIGIITDELKGQNLFGATLRLPVITAENLENSDYATAFSPAEKTYDLKSEINQKGFIIKIDRIELASDETRVYLSVTNQSNNKIHPSSYTAKIIQGSNQYDFQMNFNADYPEIQNEILPEAASSGVITFPKIDLNSPFRLYIEGYTDNFNVRIEPFVFEVK
jgi:hypothetical protein